MNRAIEKRFAECRQKGEGALVVYITAGDPSLDALPDLLETLQSAGADLIEVGIPFSDPLADGPTIQAATQRALERGTTLPAVLERVAGCQSRMHIPMIVFTYFNPVQRYGLTRFAHDARQAGFSGCLMTDLPPDEADEWLQAAQAEDLSPIFLLAPTSTEARIDLVAQRGLGFVYCVSRTGVTGARHETPPDAKALVERVRPKTSLPIAVGFGISTPEQARQVCSFADGAVVGSQLVALLHAYKDQGNGLKKAHDYILSMKDATKGIELSSKSL